MQVILSYFSVIWFCRPCGLWYYCMIIHELFVPHAVCYLIQETQSFWTYSYQGVLHKNAGAWVCGPDSQMQNLFWNFLCHFGISPSLERTMLNQKCSVNLCKRTLKTERSIHGQWIHTSPPFIGGAGLGPQPGIVPVEWTLQFSKNAFIFFGKAPYHPHFIYLSVKIRVLQKWSLSMLKHNFVSDAEWVSHKC